MDFEKMKVPIVKGKSYREIEIEAIKFLQVVAPECLEKTQATPLMEIFENKLHLIGFNKVLRADVPGLGGVTYIGTRMVELSESTYADLEDGDPVARFTTAHEMGHAALHGQQDAFGEFPSRENVMLARRSEIRAFEDPEWQANAFAAAILMPLTSMRRLHRQGRMNVGTVMRIFGVSWSAATKRIDRLEKEFE